MMYRTLIDVAFRLDLILETSLNRIYASPSSLAANLYKKFPPIMKILNDIRIFLQSNSGNLRIIVLAVLLGCVAFLVLWFARRRKFPRAAFIWMGVFF